MKSWFESLSDEDRYRRARERTERLVDHLLDIILVHELNQVIVYSDTLSKQIPRSRAAKAFNAFRRNSMSFQILRLCAIWDPSRKDRESIPTVSALLSGLSLEKFLEGEGRHAEVDGTTRQLEGVHVRVKELAASRQLDWLRTHRDHDIAHALEHSSEVVERMRAARYGHEGWLLTKSIKVVDDLHLALNGKGFMWDDAIKNSARCSRELWENCTFSIPGRV